ncbi:MAG TPA: polymer-forming cytoskeletal protein [Gemmatimonadales bacterium]|nr:polymer-forming cytoskeletal protein [Gemmatimonadales bacterium]
MAMFGAKEPKAETPSAATLSVIGVGMIVRGDIECNGIIKIEGTVDGSVTAKQQVLVAKGGAINGGVESREAIIGGTVRGDIEAAERVEIQAGATVEGDIVTSRILVAEGGTLNGQIRMREPDAKPRPETKAPPNGGQGQAPAVSGRPQVPVARVAVPPRTPAAGAGH